VTSFEPHRQRAQEALKAAETLHGAGLHADAVSRAYYASLHGAQALLAARGWSAKTHDGVRSLLAAHFVKTGELSVEASRAFAHAAADRDDADYDADAVFDAHSSQQSVEHARRFLDEVERLLGVP
jgi:uncharacterized protein (UPF0332 family)